MRRHTLAVLCFVLSLTFIYLFREIANLMGAQLPTPSFYLSGMFAFLAGVSLLIIPLSKLNGYLLDWRKARGRDIREEEKYESEAGIITLKPVSFDEDAQPIR